MSEQETELIVSAFKRLLKDDEGYSKITGYRLIVDCSTVLDPLEATVLERLFPTLKSDSAPLPANEPPKGDAD